MAHSKSPEPTDAAVSADPATDVAVEAPPEPLTPEGALEWNRYYDRYVMGGVLLLVLLVSTHRITSESSGIWSMLRTGELIATRGTPITTDPYSYTESGKNWVNIPWLYDLSSYLLFSTGKAISPTNPNDPEATSATADQIGAGVLIGVNALIRVFTVILLLGLRKKGPGVWWFAVVAAIGMGFVLSPRVDQLELSVGGIARQTTVSPATWGTLLFAAMIMLLERGVSKGRTKALYALPAIFLLWANVDDSFVFGLLILTIGVVSALLRKRHPHEVTDITPALLGSILAACFLICFVNPSTWQIFPTALGPYAMIPRMMFRSGNYLPMPEHLSFFGSDSWEYMRYGRWDAGPVPSLFYYLAIVGLGLLSFGLNFRALRPSRLVLFVVSALFWGMMTRLSAEFAVVFVYVVGLNGQEWYQRNYGLGGHVGGGWTALSVGGRALTILAFFLVMAFNLTGYNYSVGRAIFGFGFDRAEFAFEAADYLKKSPIQGEVINLTKAQGDALIWRAYPKRKTFLDGRSSLFSTEVRRDLQSFRRAFTAERAKQAGADLTTAEEAVSDDDVMTVTPKEDPAKWRPVLDKYKVSAVLISPDDGISSFIIYGGMLSSKNWILLYDDGLNVLFGRADAPPADLALFEKEKLDANEIVYKRKETVPFPDRSPTAMTFIDSIIRNRSLGKIQPHIKAGGHWLSAGTTAENQYVPPAANAILAIREARKAIHFNPDESDAYRLLDEAYEKLSINEFSVFDAKRISVPMGLYSFRARQRITALNYAIQTTPPPRDENEKLVLIRSYRRLAALHRSTRDLDLERDALAAARDLSPAGEFTKEESRRLDQLDDAIAKFKDDLQKAATSEPIQRANYAANSGFPGIAIHELEEAENSGLAIDSFLKMLVDLYCRSGQPEKANEKLTNRPPMEDQALYVGAGTPAYTHGLVNFLMGFYALTEYFWRDNALGQALYSERSQQLAVARELLAGFPDRAIPSAIDLTGIPGKPGLIESEATWEFELGLCLLEAGDPAGAGERFVRCLKFNPKIVVRPLVEDYLKKLKVPIPADPMSDEVKTPEATPDPAKPAEPPAEKPVEPAIIKNPK